MGSMKNSASPWRKRSSALLGAVALFALTAGAASASR